MILNNKIVNRQQKVHSKGVIFMCISFVNNFDFNGQMEYPLLTFTVGMNHVCMDISYK